MDGYRVSVRTVRSASKESCRVRRLFADSGCGGQVPQCARLVPCKRLAAQCPKDKVRRSCLRSFDLFSSVQDGIYALGKAHMRSSVSEVAPMLPLERSHFNVLLIGGRG